MTIINVPKNEAPNVICSNSYTDTWAVRWVINYVPDYIFFGSKKEAEDYVDEINLRLGGCKCG